MDIEEIIQEMNSGRDDILSYMFCLFEPYIQKVTGMSERNIFLLKEKYGFLGSLYMLVL